MRKRSLLIAGGLAALTSGIPAATEAQARGRTVSVQGAHGGGYVKQRSASRSNGSLTSSRSLRTNDGYGYSASHYASRQAGNSSTNGTVTSNDGRGAATSSSRNWDDGSYAGGRSTTLNDGRTVGHSAAATKNADGSITYSASRTRLDGSTAAVSGTTIP